MRVLGFCQNSLDLGVGEIPTAGNVSIVDSDLFLEIKQVIQCWCQAIGAACDGTDAWTDPITRPEVNTIATEVVAEQWTAQQPALVDAVAEELQIQFPNGIHAGRMDSEYVRRQKRDAALMAEQRQGVS